MVLIILVLIIFLLVLLPIIAGIVLAYKKLPPTWFYFVLSVLIISPIVAFNIYERNFILSFVPDALKVSDITYSKEESWGFGPGGNEAGIRVYQLPEKIADKISRRGIEFFNELPVNKNQKNRSWRGRYQSWSETPVKESDFWKRNGKTDLEIYDYICRYGFCIEIDDEIVALANVIINSEGSYYAYGRIGLIVVCPARKVVLYMFNG